MRHECPAVCPASAPGCGAHQQLCHQLPPPSWEGRDSLKRGDLLCTSSSRQPNPYLSNLCAPKIGGKPYTRVDGAPLTRQTVQNAPWHPRTQRNDALASEGATARHQTAETGTTATGTSGIPARKQATFRASAGTANKEVEGDAAGNRKTENGPSDSTSSFRRAEVPSPRAATGQETDCLLGARGMSICRVAVRAKGRAWKPT